jgi:hypothetical protein
MVKLVHQINQVAQGAAKPVQPPDNQRVPRLHLAQAFVKAGPGGFRARRLICKYVLLRAPHLSQGIALQPQLLPVA